MAKSASIGRTLRRGIVGILLILLVGGALMWAARKPLASSAAHRWCAAQGVTCAFNITQFNFGKIEVENLVVTGPSVPNLITADDLSLDINWPNIFSPKIVRISVSQPSIQAAFDGEAVTLDGLERLLETRDKTLKPISIPTLDINDGKLTITTPAGNLYGTFAASGTWPQTGSAEISFAPAQLRSGQNQLDLEAGTLNLSRIGDQIDGRLNLIVPALVFDGSHAENILLSADITGTDRPQINWQADIQTLAQTGGLNLNQVHFRGTAAFTSDYLEQKLELLQRITAISAIGEAGQTNWKDYGTDHLSLDLTATQTSLKRFDISLETTLAGARSPTLSGEDVSLTFTGSIDPATNTLTGNGQFIMANMTLAAPSRARIVQSLSNGAPFNRHARDLKRALNDGLKAFTIGSDYRLDASGSGNWQLILPRELAMQSRSGIVATLTPDVAQSALTLEPDQITMAGVLTLKGGGLPRFSADIRLLQISGPHFNLKAGGVTLQPWTAGPTTIAVNLNQFELNQTNNGLRAKAVGELTLKGRLFGVTTDRTRLFGGLDAAHGAAGWRVQTIGQKCLGLNIDSARTSNNLSLQAVSLNICPEDGRFIQQNKGQATGKVSLGDITLPFTGNDMSGTAAFRNTVIDWSAAQDLTLKISADALDLPMMVGTRTLLLKTQAPRVDLTLGNKTRLIANMDQSLLSGGLIPANVTIGAAHFDGTFAQNGFSGIAETTDVQISDVHDDPIYNPVTARFGAVFDGANVTINGPIHLASSGALIAKAELEMNLLDLNGTGRLISEDLLFSRRGLQPKDLSDLVRDVLSNGRGQLNAVADFTITEGKLTGTGQVDATEFGFDTLRLGAIEGVNGRIIFSDLLALTTPPGQLLTIADIDPGIPLKNGVLEVQVIDGKLIKIERATWPFAGGTLDMVPTEWTIGGVSDELVIEAKKLELAKLVEVLSLPDIKAEGTISGTFPIVFEGGDALISNALFTADSQGGTLSYTGNAIGQAGTADDRVDAAFTALRDFRFKVLEVGVDGNLIDDITVSARLLGNSPDVYGGAEFDFRISIESKLAQLIQSGRRAVAAKWIAEAIAVDPEPETDDPFN